MNRKIFFPVGFFAISITLALVFPFPVAAVSENIKLPYEAGQSFIVAQGYNTPPTHIGKDLYAMDLTQGGCDAYGKLALAATPGIVMLAQQSGYNGGYGTQVLVKNENNILTRYAHMIPGTIPVEVGDSVVQGEPIGEIGNTGLTTGAACPVHPGTHIHFAMYGENADGSLSPYKPEPISDYVGITTGKWYLSDNEVAITSAPGAAAIIERAMATVFGDGESVNENAGVAGISSIATETPITIPTSTAILLSLGGGVAAAAESMSGSTQNTPASSITPPPISVLPTSTATAAAAISITDESFNSTTLAIDLAWQASGLDPDAANEVGTSGAPTYQIFQLGADSSSTSTPTSTLTLIATTTATTFSYPLAVNDFSAPPQFEIAISAQNTSADSTLPALIATSTFSAAISLPDWGRVIQPRDDTNSNGSWYGDNWYDLGTGFYGLVRALTLEGFISNSNYAASHLYLDEYLDANYSQLNQTYTISDNAPFTNGLQKITIGNLAIPLQLNKYYRLRTQQDYQNRSVILAGTAATGTAMWDEYIYGTGGVQHQYSFYPYLTAIMMPDYPPLAVPNAPATATISFDSLNSIINFSWPAATDPDTTSSLLTYQWNIATMPSIASATDVDANTFDPSAWQSVGKNLQANTPVVFGNSYEIGVRAVDDLGNIGAPLTELWNFPAGYVPLPQQLDHSAGLPGGAQKITFLATTTLSGIAFWVAPQSGGYCCSQTFVSVHSDNGGSIGTTIATSNAVTMSQSQSDGEGVYGFSPSLTLSPAAYWFEIDTGPSHTTNGTSIFGSSNDAYPGGAWSTSLGQDAYFRIEE